MASPTIITLAQWLAGEFDNQAQAHNQPVWFVRLRLWQRPLPQRLQGNVALFLEQANALYPDQPYRQRVVMLQESEPGIVEAHYWALQQPERFCGAGANLDLLSQLQFSDLEQLPGCVLTVTPGGDDLNRGAAPHHFEAHPQPNSRCCFQYQGQTRQVILGFKVSSNQFWSYDRGVDPNTGQGLWGALMGAYEFHKERDFANELPI